MLPDKAAMMGSADSGGIQQNPAESDTVPDDMGEVASPEEQQAYEEFVKEGFRLMYEGGKVRPAVLALLDEDPSDLMAVLENAQELQSFNHVVALAAAAALTTLRVVQETGQKDGVIILHGGAAILEEFVELAKEAGIREYTDEEMTQAMRMGADLFRAAAEEQGLIDTSEAKGEFEELVAADKEGRLGEVLPQLAGAGQEAPPEGMPYG